MKSNTDYYDYLFIFIFFVVTIFTRFITILVFRPLIHYAGGENYRFDKWEDLVVIAYGGLRGTHSLLLALVIGHESELFRLNFTIKCVNYVSGVVFLSLLL